MAQGIPNFFIGVATGERLSHGFVIFSCVMGLHGFVVRNTRTTLRVESKPSRRDAAPASFLVVNSIGVFELSSRHMK